MRVISGLVKGRALKAVPGRGTRPTTDKVKEAIFSTIGPYFPGGIVLDLYAGTGGLGIEALSRGMDKAIFIDIERKSIEVIHDNLQATGLGQQAEVYRNDAGKAIKALGKRQLKFDLVFLDPPYRLKHMEQTLQLMEDCALFQWGAKIVVEHDAAHRYDEKIGAMVTERHAVYGDTAVTVYRYRDKDGTYHKIKGDAVNDEDRARNEDSGLPGKL